ncbi:rod shape-determining protein [Eubacterium sp. MSJ-33]|nr:rod shape-determining protein [Eubacterium sp. MSJ-33]
MAVRYHDTRSMIDGQIHDIAKVSQDIIEVKQQLEKQLGGRKLHDVCIAAAGRVLKTAIGHGEYEFSENTVITQEYIHSIDLIGVEQAHNEILQELNESHETTKYFCVGYTVVKYFLNNYEITNLEGHKGTKIAADVLATFLPEEVVDSLYAAVEQAGLYVTNLTLEPIAAMTVAIPEQYRLLNIALIDIGAGTSDICITKDGSVIAYGMIPAAGDELTEALVKKYLIDFQTAEKLKTVSARRKSVTYKDIMGISHKITPAEIYQTTEEVKETISKKIADKIIELNGGTSVSAVFVVGGGGKLPGFTDTLAVDLNLPAERVALRGEEVMNTIDFQVEGIKKDPLYVTPIGICLNFFDQKNNFIFVNVNGERVKLYNNDKLTIFDAAVQYGIPNEDIFPKRGEDITFKINEKTRIVRGYSGEAAVISQNGKNVGMNAVIEANDNIRIQPSTKGKSAEIELSTLPEYAGMLTFRVNGNNVSCPKFATVNGKFASSMYQIQDGDEVCMRNYYTVGQLRTFMDLTTDFYAYVNHQIAEEDEKIYENFEVEFVTRKEETPIIPDDEIVETVGEEAAAMEKAADKAEKTVPEQKMISQPHMMPGTKREITVIVNKTPVTLRGKESYTFVDILDFYPFDLTTMRGKRLVTNVNGTHAEFIQPIDEGAVIDIYWEN